MFKFGVLPKRTPKVASVVKQFHLMAVKLEKVLAYHTTAKNRKLSEIHTHEQEIESANKVADALKAFL